ncbi:MAG: hypothetical protein PVF47_09145 [Anaerolineae bacterium]
MADNKTVDLVQQIIEAASKLGVEVDEADAAQWLTAMAGAQTAPGDFEVDVDAGIYGHRITLLDFDPEVLDRYRQIAEIVEIPDRPGVETALSLSGSAAQSRVQLFPGDADFFERVNVQAATREEACRILADVIREKALSALQGPNYELVEVKWGTLQEEIVRDGETLQSGTPISWSAEEVQAGSFAAFTPEGESLTIDWAYGTQDPGWCKLDWVIADPAKGRVLHASNMLDATWEAPDGEIVPLDGYLDPYFQEVYLDADSIPLFSKIVKQLSARALQEYVGDLEHEVYKYSCCDPKNYGKVAKRLYNIFRLTARWPEAIFVRELFDEPAALLYQVAALIDTLDEAVTSGESLDQDTLIDQIDNLIRVVVRVTEGPTEEQIVDALLKLRDDLSGRRALGDEREAVLKQSYRQVGDLVNQYFEERLFLMPEIKAYIDSLPA